MSAKFKRRFKFSENSLDGEFLLEKDRVRLHFRFAPYLVDFVKKIPGSRYHPDTKSWSIPRVGYNQLKQAGLFPEERYRRNFTELELVKPVEELEDIEEAASAAWRQDPFSVKSEYLSFIPAEVTFFMAKDLPQLRAKVKFGSKAAGLLVRRKGCHFLRSEGLFTVPVENFPDLLIKLRDKGLSFAVEEECSRRLKETAVLRRKLLTDPGKASPAELEEAYLTPYIDFADDSEEIAFQIRFATSRHLAALFPDDSNFQARRKKSSALSESELARVVNRAYGLKYPLYLTRAVLSHLERRGLNHESSGAVLSGEIIPFLNTPSAWVVFESGRAGLLIDEKLAESFELKGPAFESYNAKRFYTASDSKFLDLYESLAPRISAQEGERFKKYLSELKQRRAEREKNQAARVSQDADIDPGSFSNTELSEKLFPHQRVAVKWLAERDCAMLGDDMGLGKTISVLAVSDYLLKNETVKFILVICPNSLTRNWIREAKQFTPRRQYLMLPDGAKQREKMLIAIKRGLIPCHGLVLNYEKARLPETANYLKQIVESRPTLLCCDESQRVKNSRSKTFIALSEISLLAKRKICLTGTPAPRDISDIWSQVYLLDQGERFGRNFNRWLNSVAELGTKYSDYAVKKYKPDEVNEAVARVHELLLRRRKEEVVKLPEKTFSYRDCKLSGSQAERYRELCERLLLKIGTLEGGSFYKQIDNLMEEYLRAVQIASNPRLIDPGWQGVPAKFTELDEIVNEICRERGEKLVIWTNFLGNVRELTERYKELGAKPFSGEVPPAERERIIHDFQNGEPQILVAIPAAGGVGITLTAAQTAVYVDKSWNAEHWLQSVDRIHRIGQRGTVTIVSLSACKIDELITRNLMRKAKAQAELLGDGKHNLEIPESDLAKYPSREELLEALAPETAA